MIMKISSGRYHTGPERCRTRMGAEPDVTVNTQVPNEKSRPRAARPDITEPAVMPSPWSWRLLIISLILFCLTLGIVATRYAQHQLLLTRHAAQKELSAIADLKVGQIVAWRQERLADAELIMGTPLVQTQAVEYLNGSAPSNVVQELTTWMETWRRIGHYQRILLYDSQGALRLASPRDGHAPSTAPPHRDHDGLLAKEVMLEDLHVDRNPAHPQIEPAHLALWIPIEPPPAPDAPARGAWMLQIDPQVFLYPLVRAWPTPSQTAEVCLVRRQGKKVICLTGSHYEEDAVPFLCPPADEARHSSAAMAVLTHEGVVETTDFRGSPVLAAVRRIPGTAWSLIAKIALNEIYAPLREEAWMAAGLLLTLILTALLGVAVLWRRKTLAFSEREVAAGHERQALLQHFDYLTRYANDIILLVDSHQQIIEVNERACTAYGYTRDELLSRRIQDLRPPELQAGFQERLDRVNLEKELHYETQHRRKDGTTFPVEIGFRLIETGGLKFYQSVIRDISDRRRAELEVETKRELLSLTGSMAKVGGWEFDAQTLKGTWTDEVARIHDLDPSLDTTVDLGISFYAPESRQRIEHAIREAIADATPYDLELEMTTALGVHKWVRTMGTPVLENGKVVKVRGIFQDITERKRNEAEIRQLNEELEQRVIERTAQLAEANRELEAFSYSVSHDLRAPLRAIIGYARMLEEDHARQLDAEGLRLLGVVGHEASRMGGLIDDLLAFSRLARQAMQHTVVDMDALARAVFDDLRAHEPKRDLRLSVGPLPPAQGDPPMIRQVFVNLLSNAIKYTRPRPCAEIEVGSRREGQDTVYFVKDNGVGFDMRYANKLFGVFQRLHSEADFEGTGVGLALVHRIIARHGGRIWADSVINQGATFSFTLPTPAGQDSALAARLSSS